MLQTFSPRSHFLGLKTGGILLVAFISSFAHSSSLSSCQKSIASSLAEARISSLGSLSKKTTSTLESILSSPRIFGATVPESNSILKSKIELQGKFFPARLSADKEHKAITFSPHGQSAFEWGGDKFVEATNPTSLILDSAKSHEEYLLPRAVLPYSNTLKPDEGVLNAPTGYYSHIPILKKKKGKWIFDDFLIKSRPDKNFFFEDPRVSGPLYDSSGEAHYFLGGTDYSRHVEGEDNLFVRNVMYPLETKDGKLHPLTVDKKTGKPIQSFFVSPSPVKMSKGWKAVDAKNGLLTQTDDGSIVVHTRFRVEPQDDPVYKSLKERYGDRVPTWKYSIQAFKFKNYEDFIAYDWDHALEDLLGQAIGLKSQAGKQRIVPQTKIVLKDQELHDFIDPALRVAGKPLGMGNGARRIRVTRKGQKLYASFNKNSQQYYAGEVPKNLQGSKKFILEDGEVSYLAPDHQLGYFKDLDPITNEERGVKRVYSGMMSLYQDDAMNLKAVYANVVQPIKPHQISGTGGILDLNHAAYFMGADLVPETQSSQKFVLRAFAGAADAHSESFDFDLVKLLSEMSPESERWKTGQVYRP